ncbi:MAG: ferritin family protein [Polyangiaceae bacterium]|nr:ferritin family protein [Polyangiaceae bacterium]
MPLAFTADEAFALAERIERSGTSFYRRAAEIVRDPAVRATLLELAEWEASHEALFGQLRSELVGAEKAAQPLDPEDDTLLYLTAMAARHVLNQGLGPAEVFRGNESALEVLEIAIGFERDSIAVFQGLEAYIPESAGRERIRRLIGEEIGHVAHLVRERIRVVASG